MFFNFLVKIFMIFHYMQRCCPENHISIASYASVTHNPKTALTAGKSHVFFPRKLFMIFPFYATFLPSKARFNHRLCKRKTQTKNHNNSWKIACFFLVVKIFMVLLFFYATFLPSKSRFNRKTCKRKA